MNCAPLKAPFDTDDEQLLALCVWREARGESLAGMTGVANVVMNRCKIAPAQGFRHDVRGNVLKPWAFSSFMPSDPNSQKYPTPGIVWQNCLAAARAAMADMTGGAVFYFSPPIKTPPIVWGNVRNTTNIGNLHFYALDSATSADSAAILGGDPDTPAPGSKP